MRVSGQHRRQQRRRAQQDDGQPQPGCVVVGADADRITAQQPEIDRHAFQDQQHQHRARRHPPQRPVSTTPIISSAAIAANGAATSKASTRQMFLIGSIPAARSSACRPRRRRPSRRFQCTVCGLPPAFSLTDVATTITVSVRLANEAGNCSALRGGAPGWVSRSWCTVFDRHRVDLAGAASTAASAPPAGTAAWRSRSRR